jgi:hypothetical protein
MFKVGAIYRVRVIESSAEGGTEGETIRQVLAYEPPLVTMHNPHFGVEATIIYNVGSLHFVSATLINENTSGIYWDEDGELSKYFDPPRSA